MATRREITLGRGVGLRLLASLLFVNLATAVFVSLGVVADEALGATPLVFLVAGLVFLLTLLGYVEGITMLPQAGGAAGFVRRGLGELPSFLAGWALLLDYLILVVLTAYFAVHYIGSIPGFAPLLHSPTDVLLTGGLIVAAGVLTFRGLRTSAATNVAVALLALGAQLLLAILGAWLVADPVALLHSIHIGVTPTWHGLLFALPIAMIGFTGLDSVANLVGEFGMAERDIPRPLIWSAVVSVVVFVFMSFVALSALPVAGTGAAAATPLGAPNGWVDRPVIGIVTAMHLPGAVAAIGRTVFGLLAAIVLFLAATAALAGLSRVAYFMSSNRQAPSVLFNIDARTGAPGRAVILLNVMALALLAVTVSVADSAVVLAQVYAFGATFTAMFAGLAILKLRFTEPDLSRPFRTPFDVRIAGRPVSVLLILGTLASTALWLLVLATHDTARVVGLAWMVFGFVAYGTYRLTHGLPLAARADVRERDNLQFDAQSYRRVLVAVRPERGLLYGAGDAELVGLANKLVEHPEGTRPEVAVMLVHELPLVDPLDAPLGDVETQTMRRLAKLRLSADKLGLRVASSVIRARAAGRAICQEAQRRDADAVLLAMRRKRRVSDDVFGKCIAYVLRHAPCDVVVLSLPTETLVERPRASDPGDS